MEKALGLNKAQRIERAKKQTIEQAAAKIIAEREAVTRFLKMIAPKPEPAMIGALPSGDPKDSQRVDTIPVNESMADEEEANKENGFDDDPEGWNGEEEEP
jgi:hypothetical protein